MKTVLLAMQEKTADAVTPFIESEDLRILGENVDYLRHIEEMVGKTSPDILLINVSHLFYDTDNVAVNNSSLLEVIKNLTKKGAQLRIALMTNFDDPKKSSFLAKAVSMGVWDVFNNSGSGIKLEALTKQLSAESNYDNVSNLVSEINQVETARSEPLVKRKKSESKRSVLVSLPNEDKNHQQDALTTDHVDGGEPLNPELAKHTGGVQQSRKKQKKNRLNEQKNIFSRFKLNKSVLKRTLVSLGALILIATLFFVGKSVINSWTAKPSFDTLLQKQEYQTAVKYYPEKAKTVEDFILNNVSPADEKSAINSVYKVSNNKFVNFDYYFFNKKYEKLIFLYESQSNSTYKHLSNNRQIMLGYSYMKTADFTKAMYFANLSHSSDLKDRIKKFKVLYNANAILEKNLGNKKLNTKDQIAAKKIISQNKVAMDSL